MFNYRGQPFIGIIEEYASNGNLVGELEFKNGYADGLTRIYFESGQIQEEYYLKYNRFYNSFKCWDSTGNLV